jgi:hypothetical protein
MQEQGRLQGAIYGVRALFDAIGAIAFGRLYGSMKTGSPVSRMAPYILCSSLYLAGTVVAVLLPSSRHLRMHRNDDGASQRRESQLDENSGLDSATEPLLGERPTRSWTGTA